MELLTLIAALVVIVFAYRLGSNNGERRGALLAQATMIKGATENLCSKQQDAFELKFRKLALQSPSSDHNALGDFLKRSFAVGQLIANANREAGESSQEAMSAPRHGRVRVDLTVDQLQEIERTANFGFRQMLRPEARLPFRFERKAEAQKAAEAIDRLSMLIGLELEEDGSARRMRFDESGDRQFSIAHAFREAD